MSLYLEVCYFLKFAALPFLAILPAPCSEYTEKRGEYRWRRWYVMTDTMDNMTEHFVCHDDLLRLSWNTNESIVFFYGYYDISSGLSRCPTMSVKVYHDVLQVIPLHLSVRIPTA